MRFIIRIFFFACVLGATNSYAQCSSFRAQKEATLFELNGLYVYTQNSALAYAEHYHKLQRQLKALNDIIDGDNLSDPYYSQLYSDEVVERLQVQARIANFKKFYDARFENARKRIPTLEKRLSQINAKLLKC